MSCYNPCNSNTAIEQAVDDALADRITDLDGYTQSSKKSAAQAAGSAEASAQSAEESKGYRDQAQQVANTATGLVPDLLETSSNLKDAADMLEVISRTASSFLVRNVYYTVVGGENTYTFDEAEKVSAVQAIYIEGIRQDAGQGFAYDAVSRTITFAETFSADQAGSVITIQVGQANADSPETVLSALNKPSGAGLVGTTSGGTVQSNLDDQQSSIQANANALNTFKTDLADNSDLNKGDALVAVKLDLVNSVPRTQHQKNAEEISVKDFGAVGDGTTDDTVAIQAAIDSARGRRIFIPAGTYRVSSLVHNGSDRTPLHLYGEGADLTIIMKIGNSTNPILMVGSIPTTYYLLYNTISGITFNGFNKTGVGIKMMDNWYVNLNNLHILNFTTGLDLGSPIFYTCTNVRIGYNNLGMSIQNYDGQNLPGTQPGMLRFSGCVFEYNATWGIDFKHGENLQLINCALENNGTTPGDVNNGGIKVSDTAKFMSSNSFITGLTMRDCHSETNKGIAVVYSTSGRLVLENTLFFEDADNTTNDVRITGGYYDISDCTTVTTTGKVNLFVDPTNVGIGNSQRNNRFATVSAPENKRSLLQDASLVIPYIKVGGSSGVAAALTFQNSATYWDMKQLTPGSASFGVYNGTSLAAYWDASKNFNPGGDNTISLGTAPNRWSVVFSGTGTINTSDADLKTDIQEISAAERRVAKKLQVKRYKFKDAEEAKEGKGRYHFGVIAQEVRDAFESEGLDAHDYGLFCEDSWEDQEALYNTIPAVDAVYTYTRNEEGQVEKVLVTEAKPEERILIRPAVKAGTRLGIRYDELLAFKLACL